MTQSSLHSTFRRPQNSLAGTLAGIVVAVLVAACSGGGGGGGSSSANGSTPVGVVAPIIATQPQSVRVNDGQPATFAVGAVSATAPSYQWSRNGTAIAGANASTYTVAAAQLGDDGALFSVAVSNAGGTVQSASATLNVSPIAPSLSNNVATTVAVVEGQPATFSVTASGSLPLSFQWRRGGVAIPGATSSTYTIAATALADNGATFDVVVSNAAGTVTSASFTLSVTARVIAPAITTQPLSQTVRAGNPVTFTVAASGTAPLAYQWFRNGAAIAGATGSSYTLASTVVADSGAQFSVVVANTAGTVTSAAATVTVLPQASLALVAGNIGGPGNIDGSGTAARVTAPAGPAIDNGGNVFFGDGSTVREFSAGGVVSTVAGQPTVIGTVDGTGSAALFGIVSAVAVDGSGTIYAVDSRNHNIRRITTAAVVTTYAGTTGTSGSADGTGTAASFNAPGGIAIDAMGNVYVADTGNQTIRRIGSGGVVTTLAGSAGTAGSADGTGAAARFNAPSALAVDAAGNVYVADLGNDTIRKITAGGVVTTLAGRAGVAGAVDGTGSAALFNQPTGIAVDAIGNVYVGDGTNRTIRKVTPTGVVTMLAGTAGVSGFADGTGAAASFSTQLGVASDSSGSLYVTDRGNFEIRRISTSAVVTTVVGAVAITGSADGTGAGAGFNGPYGIASDASGVLYVGDAGNGTIRKVTTNGVVTTLAGTAGLFGAADGTGAAARFGSVRSLAVGTGGTIYAADYTNNTIRAITAAGVVTTVAGNPLRSGASDGTGGAATFNGPSGIAIDASGNLFVTDTISGVIRRVTPAGVVTTFAGTAGRIGAQDGTGAAASFNLPTGIAIDSSGNLFVVDSGSNTVRKITPAAVVTTFVGVAGTAGSLDGAAPTASFRSPTGLAIDRANRLFVVDTGNFTVRRIDTVGNVTTVVGTADGRKGVRLGTLPGALDQPLQIAIDAAGNLYLTDLAAVLTFSSP